MTLALLCIAALAVVLFALGANVSRNRGTSDTQFPTDPRSPLLKAMRAHGNAAEHVPMLALLIFVVAARQPSTVADVAAVGAVGARVLHAGALLTCASLADNTVARTVGAVATTVAGVTLAVLVALSA